MTIAALTARIRRRARWIGRRLQAGRSGVAGAASGARDPYAAVRAIDGPSLLDIPPFATERDAGGRARVTVLMPTLQMARMTGGANTAFNLTARLAAQELDLRFATTFGHVDDDFGPIREHVATLTGQALPPSVEFVSASREVPLPVRPNDVFVATWWPTAHVANAALPMTRANAFIYLVQDFEPAFYPWSTNYALALSSYEFPARVVFNESLLADHFRASRIGVFAGPTRDRQWTSFQPAVDRSVFRPDPSAGPRRDRRRLVFYARPSRPRNCFELGLRAIRLAAQDGALHPARWEVVSIGADVPELDLAPGLVMRPAPWMSYAEYGAFLGGSDILLSLMLSPHTSYPPLEMAAAGGIVVTNTFGVKTETALRALSPRLLAAPPDAAAVASVLGRAAALVDEGRPDGTSPSDVALPATWDDAFADVLPWLVGTVTELVGER